MTDINGAFRALSAHLRAERARADLTQPELSKLTGIHVVTLSNLERDKANMSMEQLFKIAPALGISPGRFFNAALTNNLGITPNSHAEWKP